MIVPYERVKHQSKLLDLINCDRILGQPYCNDEMLADAEAGISFVDSGWWQALQKPEIFVMIAHEKILGSISFAHHKLDPEAYILWSHTRENRDITQRIYEYALLSIKNVKKINAFYIASSLTCGLEGLPRHERSITHEVLVEMNFRQMNLWSYRHLNLENYDAGLAKAPNIELLVEQEKDSWKISRKINGLEISFCNIGLMHKSIGVIWMVETLQEYRKMGIGRAVIKKSIEVLKAAGAKEIILYVDDDADPSDERDRRPAKKLYDSLGIIEVDRLYSYDVSI